MANQTSQRTQHHNDQHDGVADELGDAEPHAEASASSDDVSLQVTSRLILVWIQNLVATLSASSKLILADTRLALTSSIQLAVLAILFAAILFSAWIMLMILLALTANYLGVSPLVTVGMIFLLHLVALVIIALAMQSTFSGLRFNASRDTLGTLNQFSNE